MTIFVDPLGQYTFEIPPEWAYDAVKSHLITVFFSRWDRHEETLFVRALPALAPDADDDEWCSEAAAQMFPKDAAPIRLRCGEGVALFAEVESDGDSPAHTSALLMRGARLDALAQHSAPGRSKDTGIAEPLTTICRTLQVPTNAFAPQMIGRAKIDEHLMAAQAASAKGDWDETLSQASRAMPHARSAYLSGIASGAMLPEVPAAVAVIGSLIFRGQAQPDLLALRDAERLIARAARTARELPLLRASSRRAVLNDLHGQLEMVNSTQRAIIEHILEDGTPGDAPLPLVVVNALVSLACKAYERRNYDASLKVAEAAAEELLSLLAAAQAAGGAASVLGPALKARVQEAGALSDEEKLALSRGSVAKFDFWAKSKNLVSGIQ